MRLKENTYSDGRQELIEVDVTASVFVEEFHQDSNLLGVKVYSVVSETALELLGVKGPVFVIIEAFEHLSEASDS